MYGNYTSPWPKQKPQTKTTWRTYVSLPRSVVTRNNDDIQYICYAKSLLGIMVLMRGSSLASTPAATGL